MIVIRVELHSAQTGGIETIGTTCIFNDHSGDTPAPDCWNDLPVLIDETGGGA